MLVGLLFEEPPFNSRFFLLAGVVVLFVGVTVELGRLIIGIDFAVMLELILNKLVILVISVELSAVSGSGSAGGVKTKYGSKPLNPSL